MMWSNRLVAGGVLVVLVASMVALSAASGADANDGEPITAGGLTLESQVTQVANVVISPDCGPGDVGVGLEACGGVGLSGTGIIEGVVGHGAGDFSSGVRGSANGVQAIGVEATGFGSGSTGVKASGSGADSTGVFGLGGRFGVTGITAGGCIVLHGCAVGVQGTNTSNGYGVQGSSVDGVGVVASSANGTALSVSGKARFSRSGVVSIASGSTSKSVTLAGVTTSSMVLVTAQQNKAVTVKAAVPAAGSFRIFLTGNAPSGGLKVAYFVLN
ncbi:MAG TPA: hypothetical protein VH419_03125 [Nocardioidaceae bacterium]